MREKKSPIRLPRVACEITARGVAVLRSEGTGGISACHARALPAGALTPALGVPNVVNSKALSEALGQALLATGARGQNVIAVLPDAAARLTILDFDSLPDRRGEAEAAVRFRLRKSLPFDVEKASVSFDVQRTAQGLHVVAAVIPHTTLTEYEKVFRDAGCEPGVVLPSSLAALAAVPETGANLMLKLSLDTTTVAIVLDGQLVLLRTLEGYGDTTPTVERLAEDIYPSLVYFQDHHGANVERLLLNGPGPVTTLSAALETQAGVPVRELIASGTVEADIANEFAGATAVLLQERGN
jgi:type IV pilus assembly protein PilM